MCSPHCGTPEVLPPRRPDPLINPDTLPAQPSNKRLTQHPCSSPVNPFLPLSRGGVCGETEDLSPPLPASTEPSQAQPRELLGSPGMEGEGTAQQVGRVLAIPFPASPPTQPPRPEGCPQGMRPWGGGRVLWSIRYCLLQEVRFGRGLGATPGGGRVHQRPGCRRSLGKGACACTWLSLGGSPGLGAHGTKATSVPHGDPSPGRRWLCAPTGLTGQH